MIDYTLLVPALLLGVINIVAFIAMYQDKQIARRGNAANRTPEGILFFLATIGGSLGIYAGMLLLRHKTRTWYFQIGIPILIIQNLITIYCLAGYVM